MTSLADDKTDRKYEQKVGWTEFNLKRSVGRFPRRGQNQVQGQRESERERLGGIFFITHSKKKVSQRPLHIKTKLGSFIGEV